MLKIGVDSTKFPGASNQSAGWLLERASEIGLDGVFYRSILELSSTLDALEIQDVMQTADDLGLRVEAGVAKVNPFAAPERPAVRALGEGDYLLGLRKMVLAATSAGIYELWTAAANYQFCLPGIYAYDRFRTDVEWSEQLEATVKLLKKIAPILRDAHAHLNLETHEEITSFEAVRLVEEVGSDVMGITFDSANVLVRCEDPVAAVNRAAPYIRSSHIRDVALVFTPDGISRFLRPVGDGILDWEQMLRPLLAHDLMLSIEGIIDGRAEMALQIFDERWQHGHPDLTLAEAFEVIRLTRAYETSVASGVGLTYQQLREPVAVGEPLEFIERSAQHLRSIIAEMSAAQVDE